MANNNPLAGIADILDSLDLDDSVSTATDPQPAATAPAKPSASPAAALFNLADITATPEPKAAASKPAAVSPPNPVLTPQVDNSNSGIPVDIAKQIFYDAPRKNVEKYCPYVMRAMQEVGLGDVPMLLMALGTIRAETAGFCPISEYKSKYNTSPGGQPFDLYDDRKALGNRGAPDGNSFKGRGFIQLTGRANYTQLSEKLGLGTQLVDNPDLANDPEIAARLLAAFIKNKERKIRTAIKDDNLKSARRYINGGSHGLAQFSEAFNKGMQLMGLA